MKVQALLIGLVSMVTADFECICNYNLQYPVHDQPAEVNVDTLGYLFEFDCKEKLTAFSTGNYTAIAFDHMVGYILNDDQIQGQVCQGDPSAADMLTTSAMPSTTSMQPQSSTTTVRMTSTSGPSSQWTTTAPSMTPSPQSTTSGQQPTSKQPMSTTTSKLFTTQYQIVPSAGPVTKDNLNLCSKNLISAAKRYGYAIGQFNQSCYQLRTTKSSWLNAESYCRSHGGHLFDISNSYEQDYIMAFLSANKFRDEVWMGLLDKGSEENFHWVSGEKLTYTNWYPYRKDDIDNHNVEDCAVLIPFPPFNGQWDDIHCGSVLGILDTKDHFHSYICQFGINSLILSRCLANKLHCSLRPLSNRYWCKGVRRA